ncbi:hypothetical protein G6F50_015110 [Rhizopus delemar]|uniref:Molybdopterin oxidoreductase domain-containing protein n=1 Tax=Rhizopus delemar TaxID=936053 RepID=A0A9P6XZW3_9FUNG|nr:hypothetical protein G6F50_015110 [Rhizopus delemar]
MRLAEAPVLLLRTNKPDGFDCPGCAWPDKAHTSTFQFCENGAKAVTWEATKKRVTPEFFAAHTVTELQTWSDHDLENAGRLTHPLIYDAASDTYQPIEWDAAFARIGSAMASVPEPDMVEFYTSGLASNEAAFLFSLHGVAGRLRRLRPDHFDGTQPRHQPSAHDGHLARMRAPRRTHHRVQPLAGTGARALRRPADRQ